MDIDEKIVEEIQNRISAAEIEHDVKVVFACESGSRAWGFASPDSDYDVRFIYVRKQDWYLTFDVERRRDVIEYPIVDDIDIAGWDIRKALYLFTRTNGALLEWIASPIVYRNSGDFASQLSALAPLAHNDIALRYHYSHMAKRNVRDQLSKDKIKLKKYFYILRPLLAIRYIEQDHGLPPVQFQKLVDTVAPDGIRGPIADLIKRKQQTPELGVGDHVPELDLFINTELEQLAGVFQGGGRPDLLDKPEIVNKLNVIFQSTIKQSYN